MRGVALADLHLGFQGPGRLVGGRNAREIDVEAAWSRAVENTVLQQPDLITIAGDVLHNPRVSVHAIKAYRDGVRRMVEETGGEIIIIQGNHDAVRSTASRSPIEIPDDYPRVHVILEPCRLDLFLGGQAVSVACFPFVALGTDVAFKVEPNPTADVNVLLVHAAVKGSDDGDSLPYFYGGGLGALDIGREADRWDVVAVGDYHEFTRLHPTRLAFYSGSIERTSSNIWPEQAPKGVVAYDTDAGMLEFVEHETRRIEDHDCGLPATAEAVNEYLRMLLEDRADSVVRLCVEDFPRAEKDQIDWTLVRELKSRCLHFQLDMRYAKQDGVVVRDRRAGPSRTVEEAAREFFADDRHAVQAIAFRHLDIDQQRAEVAETEAAEEEPELEVAHA